MLTRAGLLLPPITALGRPTDRGRLVLPVDRRPVDEPGLVDRTALRPPAGRRRQHQHRCGGTGAGPATTTWPATGDTAVRLRRRFRSGPTHGRAVRCARPGRGAYPRRP